MEDFARWVDSGATVKLAGSAEFVASPAALPAFQRRLRLQALGPTSFWCSPAATPPPPSGPPPRAPRGQRRHGVRHRRRDRRARAGAARKTPSTRRWSTSPPRRPASRRSTPIPRSPACSRPAFAALDGADAARAQRQDRRRWRGCGHRRVRLAEGERPAQAVMPRWRAPGAAAAAGARGGRARRVAVPDATRATGCSPANRSALPPRWRKPGRGRPRARRWPAAAAAGADRPAGSRCRAVGGAGRRRARRWPPSAWLAGRGGRRLAAARLACRRAPRSAPAAGS